jgi:methionyl-tRNA formyltransferase
MMSPFRRIGLLTKLASPITHPTIVRLKELGIDDLLVLCEGSHPSAKVMDVLTARTAGDIRFHSRQEIEALGVDFQVVANVNDASCIESITGRGCRVIGNCGVSRIIRKPLLEATPLGVLNCHPGKLPSYRGRNPVEWALLNGDEVAASVHFMVEALDAGPIVRVEPLPVSGLRYHQIRARMLLLQAKILAECLVDVLAHNQPLSGYPPQGAGRVWPAMDEKQIANWANRVF